MTSNAVLTLMREDDWKGDPFGVGMAWAWACAEVLADAGASVPGELAYRPSIAGPDAGPDAESYETRSVWHLVNRTPGVWVDPNFGATLDDVRRAALILHRWIEWCVSAGKDY